MLCVAITGSYKKTAQQIQSVLADADLIELRLDMIDGWNIEWLEQLRKQFRKPMIFVLRPPSQGGHYKKSEANRLEELRQLAALEPEYLDLESTVPASFVAEIKDRHPDIDIILSYHDFKKIPEDLDSLYEKMRQTPASLYKIAVNPKDTTETLRFISWAKKKNTKNNNNIIALCMGAEGEVSRIVAPLIGNPITFASLAPELESAPGQIPFKILSERYRYHSLGPETKIFGLIGNPVVQSIGDRTHNQFFEEHDLDAVYVKMRVEPGKLKEFLQVAKQLRFRGFSVTMPHKEKVIPFLDEIDAEARQIGAVNTLVWREGKWIGYNTDGIGALNAIEKVLRVKEKRVVILGAGGSAKAIAFEAHRRGALLVIVNRDKNRAQELAKAYGGKAWGLEEMHECSKEGYEVIINTIPVGMPIEKEDILRGTVVMDIIAKHQGNDFLEAAKEKGCKTMTFYEMFMEQALRQFKLWFGL